MVIMVAERNTQDFLGLVLFDDETIQVLFNIPRLVLELKSIVGSFCRLFRFRLVRSHLRENARPGLKMLPHQFLELALELFRSRRTATSAHSLQLMISAPFVNREQEPVRFSLSWERGPG